MTRAKAQMTLEAFFRPRTGEERNDGPPRQAPRLEAQLDAFSFPPRLAPTDPRGRPVGSTKYVVRVMPESTVALVLERLRMVNNDAVTVARLVNHFREFQSINKIHRDDVALFAFITDIGTQGLRSSTCRAYARLVLEGCHRCGRRITGPLVSDLMKVLSLMEAEDDVRHAPDFLREKLEELLWSLPPSKLRLTFYILFFFGCRAADAIRLTGGSFRIQQDGSVRVVFRITKNRRTKAESYAINVIPSQLIPELREVVTTGAENIPILDCDEFNRTIKPIAETAGMKGLTTYSLRRSFIQQVIEQKTTGDCVQWLEVARMTGHHDLETIRVRYTSSLFDATL